MLEEEAQPPEYPGSKAFDIACHFFKVSKESFSAIVSDTMWSLYWYDVGVMEYLVSPAT